MSFDQRTYDESRAWHPYPGERKKPKGLEGAKVYCLRHAVFRKRGGKCHICTKKLPAYDDWHIDHDKPQAQGGSHEWENLQPACRPCNLKKQDGSTLGQQLLHGVTEAPESTRTQNKRRIEKRELRKQKHMIAALAVGVIAGVIIGLAVSPIAGILAGVAAAALVLVVGPPRRGR